MATTEVLAALGIAWAGLQGGSETPPVLITGSGTVRLVEVRLQPNSVVAGTSVRGAVILSGPAPAGGATVYLASSQTDVRVPSQVTIRPGQRSAWFTVQTLRSSNPGLVRISALRSKTIVSALLTVRRA